MLTVKDVMTTAIAVCRAETNVAEAASLMWENDCGALPVVAASGEVNGIVTDRNICIALGTRNIRSSDLSVRDVLQDHVLSCKPSDDVHTALETMRQGKVRRLPVLDDERHLEGIVSMDDIVLKAEPDGRTGSRISYGDAIRTLQTIYSRNDARRGQGAVA
jgi:CBS domain-containing protein